MIFHGFLFNIASQRETSFLALVDSATAAWSVSSRAKRAGASLTGSGPSGKGFLSTCGLDPSGYSNDAK
jgi:hypothetical protein